MLPATAILSGTLYVIGCRGRSFWHSSVEYYIPAVNKWVTTFAMTKRKSYPQAGVANNFLYVYGSDDIAENFTIEKYNPEEDNWTLVRVFKELRRNCGDLSIL